MAILRNNETIVCFNLKLTLKIDLTTR